MLKLLCAAAAIAAGLGAPLAAATAAEPADGLAGLVGALLTKTAVGGDWRTLDKQRGIRWAPLPPKMLVDCLPDGGCFTRDGIAEVGGRRLDVTVSGARMMAGNIYLRNAGAPFGEAAVLDALRRAGFRTELERCPMPGTAGGTNWYVLGATARTVPGVLAIQTRCNGRPCERFAVHQDAELPPLPAEQLRFYTEQCSAAPATRKPVATTLPHEQLAQLLAAVLPRANAPALPDWNALRAAAPAIHWNQAGPQKGSLTYKNDLNPWHFSGHATFVGRSYHVVFAGTPTHAKAAYFDEATMHVRREDVLGVLRAQGLALQLVRCGPAYTHSINNWYRVSGGAMRPVMLRQSIRLDGTQLQDAYEVRFDASLPARDARDREPGVAGCR